MAFIDEPDFQGDNRADFIVNQFMRLLSDSERVDFIINFQQLEERKRATDINFQMKKYWLEDGSNPAARPHLAILRGYLTDVLTTTGGTYKIISGSTLGAEKRTQYSAQQFSPRLSSYSDSLIDLLAYIEGYELQSVAFLLIENDLAHWEIAAMS